MNIDFHGRNGASRISDKASANLPITGDPSTPERCAHYSASAWPILKGAVTPWSTRTFDASFLMIMSMVYGKRPVIGLF